MSIRRVDSNSDLKNRIVVASTTSAVAGTAYTATKKNWLYKNNPSDVFVKKVSKHLEENATPEQRKEASIINSFVRSVVDPEVDVQTVKPQIKASKELSEAIKSNPAEDVDAAIERVFSEPDTTKLKENLLNLQNNTKSDKLFGRNAALKLVHENFDAEKQVLKKNSNTSEALFKMMKSTAKVMQAKTAAVGGVVTGAVAAALTLVFTDVNHKSK